MISLFSAVLFAAVAFAQGSVYTDTKTGITFWEQDVGSEAGANGLKFGIALPAATQTQYQDEYIGHMVIGLTSGAAWAGLAHGGSMTNNLLLVAWPNAGKVITSFRYASGYTQPDLYNGNATLTTISQTVNTTHAEIVYRCQHCWVWSQSGGSSGSAIPATTSGALRALGWAKHTALPTAPADPDSGVDQHVYYGIAVATVASARNTAYTSWISQATGVPTTTKPSTSATPTSTTCAPSQSALTDAYDYIVVGAGAGGITLAAKLSEDGGKKVLLIERGPPSSGRWGGTMRPNWLSGTKLTRFDVPGLCNQIWHDSAGIACSDAPSMAGCVLGGGTAVNAGLWWKANPADFDEVFPPGWRSGEVQQAITRVFQKIPGTYVPSMDGKTYLRDDYNQVASALASAGWAQVDANANPASKNRTFSQTPYMFSNGERGGPMATYLLEASKRTNFKLIMNTAVRRIVRTNSTASGVELQATNSNGFCGTVKLAAKGKVILSAGIFGTTKILFRSGIGPTDQLNVVKASADGPTMVASSQWINLPVGKNLDDHTNTNLVVQYNASSFYDFYAAYDNPVAADKTLYLNKRSGILAQSAPNIGPIFWEVIKGSDGVNRQLQWTARVEGDQGFADNTSMVLSQYLGRGKTSRGQLTINPDLTISISQLPFVNTAGDISVIVQGIENVKAAIAKNSKLGLLFPTPTQSIEDFVSAYPDTIGARTANHWVGTAKMGTDSGLISGGTSVVDTSTKVYGTDNIFVVDASIFPGIVTTNPSALIMAVAERAWEYITGLG